MTRYLVNHQNPDGGYGLHIEGHSTMFGACLSYVSLRILGCAPDHAATAACRKWILVRPPNSPATQPLSPHHSPPCALPCPPGPRRRYDVHFLGEVLARPRFLAYPISPRTFLCAQPNRPPAHPPVHAPEAPSRRRRHRRPRPRRLAVLGVYDWAGLNPMPPEMWLLPTALPMHPSRMWCHCRQVYLPMSYMYGIRGTCKPTPLTEALRKELYSTVRRPVLCFPRARRSSPRLFPV